MGKFQTESEEIFASYLENRGLKYSYEKSSGRRSPDFWVSFDDATVVCEVKQIEAETPPGPGGWLNPYEKIVQAIRGKAKQGRELKGKFPYVIVIRKHHFWPVDEISVPGAMFGELAISMPLDTTSGQARAQESKTIFSRGATLQTERNRVVSAVAILDRLNPTKKVVEAEISRRIAESEVNGDKIVEIIIETYDEYTKAGKFEEKLLMPWLQTFHNPHATLPVPEGFFSGTYDRQWGLTEEGYGLIGEGNDISL